MSVVDSKYKNLYPAGHFLHDEVVLAQAWKKSHTFIRRHNWYADTLELDASAVCLPNLLTTWATAVSNGNYRTDSPWLVPAPKSGLWTFKAPAEGGWGPRKEDESEEPVLRPLAHIGLREQTIATAVMLCLANCIESAQGDPSLPADRASASGVYSYGNRLFCSWSQDHTAANFPWGNSNTYSRYFQDYQRFVARPVTMAARAEADGAVNVYIASLDISAFYDNINIDILINRLEDEYEDYATANQGEKPSSHSFWKIARSALQFKWRLKDAEMAALFRSARLPNGLPQGLVASGFFANAYLLKFDRAIGAFFKKKLSGLNFVIHDYCRYVDDLRLVISVNRADDEIIDEAHLTLKLSEWVQGQLKKHTSSIDIPGFLSLNSEKTKLEQIKEIGGDSRTATRMKSLQQQLSGPFDLDSLRHAESGLNGLLSLAELGLIDNTRVAEHSLLLATIAKTKLEIKDDTLTRFSAYRLSRSLRMRRSMTDLTEEGVDGAIKDGLIQDFQTAARRLVAAWAVNPSLVQVLRYALDLFPSAEILEPITQALLSKIRPSPTSTEYEKKVAYYVFAELFKAGATETGHANSQDASFIVADVNAYRIALGKVALEVTALPGAPWYVQQQASLLLSALRIKDPAATAVNELRLHCALQSFFQFAECSQMVSIEEELAISLVGYQLISDVDHYKNWLTAFLASKKKSQISLSWTVIAEINPNLFNAILDSQDERIAYLVTLAPKYLIKYWLARNQVKEPPAQKRWLSLMTVMSNFETPFAQENALIKLALKITESKTIAALEPELLNPLNIEIKSTNWGKANDPRFDEFELRPSSALRIRDRIYETPSWCQEGHAWMYAVGRLLRAAATGEPDFTARHWLLREDAGWYVGLRSTWHKRRTGMLHTGEALRGTSAAITPWFSELLLILLRWPGITATKTTGVPVINSRRVLIKLLRDRLNYQQEIYGESSNLPIYRYPVEWSVKRQRGLRVAVVQGLMPLHKDFAHGLEGLEAPGYRERHRNHTAAMLSLANKHLAVRDYVLGTSSRPHLDLVVFPELTIHVGDQDLMRSFSDATGAMLFYSLLGAEDSLSKKTVNAGRWLVPQRRFGRRSWVEVDQGKYHLTPEEIELGINSWRPYQVVIELVSADEPAAAPYRLTASICFDATDISLAADLRDESHLYVVAAMNKDVKTFDGMIAALRYHMYQHVVIANVGEFGGSTAQAPYDKEHRRLISHSHGSEQLAISVFDIRMEDFGPQLEAAKPGKKIKKIISERIGKAPPAGLNR